MTYEPQRRKEDRIPGRIFAFFRRFFLVIGVAATICGVLLFVTLTRVLHYAPPPLPGKIVLTYTFKGDLVETVDKPSLSHPLLRPATTLHEVTDALHAAAKDQRVIGFVGKLEDVSLSLAQVQELRDAVAVFRKGGKFAWIYGDSFGSFSPGMGDYYLASAFDKIWLQPIGALAITGVAAEVPFGKDLLDKIGVRAEFSHKGTYKSMPEMFTRTGMSDPHREMMQSLIGDLSDQISSDIAKSRGMKAEEVRALIDRAPFGDKEALKEKLIDRIGYYDEMLEEGKKKAGVTDDGLVSLTGYAFLADEESLRYGMVGFTTKLMRRTGPPGIYRDKAKIALIYGAGDIVPYAAQAHMGFTGFGGGGGMAADKIVSAFHDAMKDPNVAAVVFRVDSPGGSPEAAESIRRAIIETQKKGRPVVVSMGGYAASGGYWVATPADKIVAEPATLTGSIGVFGGKVDASGLFSRIGVNWDSVSEGRHARMWSTTKPFSEEEAARFEAMLGDIYDAFLDRVAEGRKITKEEAEAVAEGRVWTGRQAKEKKLVDELGGLDRAIELARAEAKIPATQPVPVLRFPPQKSAFELFLSLAIDGAESSALPLSIDATALKRAAETEAWNGILRMPEADIR